MGITLPDSVPSAPRLLSERVKIDDALDVLIVEGVYMTAEALLMLAKPEPRALYRFHREGDIVTVRRIDESQVIWLDEEERNRPFPGGSDGL